MADNYLEKKMEEFKAMPTAGVACRSSKNSKTGITLTKLVEKNKEHKEFDNKILTRQSHLKELAELHPYHKEFNIELCTDSNQVASILETIKKVQPQWLNFNSQETLPKALIVIRNQKNAEFQKAAAENRTQLRDSQMLKMGMLIQTILLRATEMGLGGTYTVLPAENDVNPPASAADSSVDYSPLAVVAIGKGKE